jgi:hypothetical protein
MPDVEESARQLTRRQQRYVERYQQLGATAHERLRHHLKRDGCPVGTGPLADVDALVSERDELREEGAALAAALQRARSEIAEHERDVELLSEGCCEWDVGEPEELDELRTALDDPAEAGAGGAIHTDHELLVGLDAAADRDDDSPERDRT